MTADAAAIGGQVTLRQVQARGRVRGVTALLGPAFVASVAYVDPGNFATNFAGGAEHGYELAWVIVMASLMAILVQYLTSKAGLATGRSLPELCRERFGRRANALLWLQAEAVAMATDLAEFVGAAVGINLLFGVPLLPAGLITAVVAFLILGLQQRGYRRFELAIIALLALVGLGFAYLFFAAGGQRYPQLAGGLLPRLGGADTVGLTVGIIGATVMPHVVYLHSALHKDRVRAAGAAERRTLLTYNKWDCLISLGLAGLVNLAMLCIATALFHKPGLTGISDLGPVHAHLATLAGGGAALAFGVALMASGLSSSSVGTYAGQIVMAGFIEPADPAAGPPRADHGPLPDHPRPGRQPQPGTGLVPDHPVLRHPLRPHPPAAHHPRPGHHDRHAQSAPDQHPDAPGHSDHHRPEPLPPLPDCHRPALTPPGASRARRAG